MPRSLKSIWLWLLLFALGLLLFLNAAQKPFWFDEILTLRIAECGIGSDMWRAMTAGFEFNPPGIYVATQWAELAFGRGHITSRLPSLLAGLVTLLCIFHVSCRKGGRAAGFGALFLLCCSGAFAYFYEARAYALVMAGTMIAWVGWQQRIELDPDGQDRSRPLPLLGIVFGLTLALTSHMWALVVPACFAASAIARRLDGKTLDRGALAAMITPGLVTLSYPPIVAATRGVQFAGEIYGSSLKMAYEQTFGNLPLFLLGCSLFFVAGSLLFRKRGIEQGFPAMRRLTLEDTVLAVALICAPIAIYAATTFTHSAFMTRYALVAALGVSVLFGQAFSFFEQSSRPVCFALFVAIGFGLVGYGSLAVIRGWHVREPIRPELATITKVTEIAADNTAENREPVVYTSGLAFLQADFYASTDIAPRLVYVADRALAKQNIGTDGVDSAYVLGRQYFKLRGRIVSYEELKSSLPSFWLVDDEPGPLNWISEQLRADGAEIRALNVPKMRIFHVVLSQGGPR
jgi:hypothetical protein